MSRNLKELRKKAEAGKLSEDEVAYVKAREGVAAFDAIRDLADDDVSFEEDDDEDEDEDPIDELSHQELKDALDAREIDYKGNASGDELRALLRGALEAESEDD